MARASVDVQLARHASLAKLPIQRGQPLIDVRPVVCAAEKERPRRVAGHFEVVGERGIEQHLEVRPRALAVDAVLCVLDTGVVTRRCQRCQFPACGEAHHTDTMRIQPPGDGAAAYQPNRALHIGKGVAFDRVGRAGRTGQPVLENECSHAMLAKEGGDVVALMVHPELGVTAAGNHDDRRSGRLLRAR